MERKESISPVTENNILNYFSSLNGEEIRIDRGTYAINRASDTADIRKIAVIVGLVISIHLADVPAVQLADFEV